MPSTEPVVDLYLLPVPRDRLAEYRAQAQGFAELMREHGCRSYREWVADPDADGDGFALEDGLVQTFALVEFASDAERAAVMERVMADARAEALTSGEQPADMRLMRYGGFQPLVT